MLGRLLILVLSLVIAGCSFNGEETGPKHTISREEFVEAYRELRLLALQGEGRRLTVTARNRLLDSLGVQEEDLLRFVDVHGTDVQFMRGIWEEVDSVLEALRRPEVMTEDPG